MISLLCVCVREYNIVNPVKMNNKHTVTKKHSVIICSLAAKYQVNLMLSS